MANVQRFINISCFFSRGLKGLPFTKYVSRWKKSVSASFKWPVSRAFYFFTFLKHVQSNSEEYLLQSLLGTDTLQDGTCGLGFSSLGRQQAAVVESGLDSLDDRAGIAWTCLIAEVYDSQLYWSKSFTIKTPTPPMLLASSFKHSFQLNYTVHISICQLYIHICKNRCV